MGGKRGDSAHVEVPLEDVCYFQGITDRPKIGKVGYLILGAALITLVYFAAKNREDPKPEYLDLSGADN